MGKLRYSQYPFIIPKNGYRIVQTVQIDKPKHVVEARSHIRPLRGREEKKRGVGGIVYPRSLESACGGQGYWTWGYPHWTTLWSRYCIAERWKRMLRRGGRETFFGVCLTGKGIAKGYEEGIQYFI
jgi:hypothetical protein